MVDFLEERMLGDVVYGSSFSESFAVDKVRTANGSEFSRLRHPYPIRRFRLSCREPLADVWADVMNLWYRAYGTHAGFRLQAFDDYTSTANGRSAPTMLDQTLPRISAGVYQLIKEYGKDKVGLAGIGRPLRTIWKPVSGSLLVAVNGVAKVSGVSCDWTTGRLTLTPAPVLTDSVTAGFEFDHPVRFDTDLEIGQDYPAVRMIERMELVELVSP